VFDARWYSDTYDLYRPSVAVSAGGVQAVTVPETATASGQSCRIFVGRPPAWVIGREGIDQDYDAVMLVPASRTLQPEAANQQPDHVTVSGTAYVVLSCHDARNQGLFKRALLRQVH